MGVVFVVRLGLDPEEHLHRSGAHITVAQGTGRSWGKAVDAPTARIATASANAIASALAIAIAIALSLSLSLTFAMAAFTFQSPPSINGVPEEIQDTTPVRETDTIREVPCLSVARVSDNTVERQCTVMALELAIAKAKANTIINPE